MKIVVVSLASFAALFFLCQFFPGFASSTISVESHNINVTWLSFAGIAALFYKLL